MIEKRIIVNVLFDKRYSLNKNYNGSVLKERLAEAMDVVFGICKKSMFSF